MALVGRLGERVAASARQVPGPGAGSALCGSDTEYPVQAPSRSHVTQRACPSSPLLELCGLSQHDASAVVLAPSASSQRVGSTAV